MVKQQKTHAKQGADKAAKPNGAAAPTEEQGSGQEVEVAEAATVAASIVAEAQERATSVVLGYRGIDWDAVKAGEEAAVRALVAACERHDATRRFLQEEDCGEVGAKLDGGLDRFYAATVAPKLGDPQVILQLTKLPATATTEEMSVVPAGGIMSEGEGLAPRSRPQVTVGNTVRMNTGCGHLYVTVNESEDGKPFELFNHMGKAGGCAASQNEAIGRLISYALRCGAKLDPLIKQLKGISCHRPAWGEGGKISSCSDAIGKALETYHHTRELREESRQLSAAGNGPGNVQGSVAGLDSPSVVRESLSADLAGDVSFDAALTGASDVVAERWVEPGAELRSAAVESKGGHGNKGSQEIHRVQGACVDCGSQLSFEEGCVKCHSCGFTECG